MELWAGMLIALSLACCRRGWLAAGVVTGVSALFFRELALPYVVVSFGLAARQGRRREALGWGLGLAAFALFMAVHAHEVLTRLTPSDLAMEGGWVRFGGVRFVLATAQANVFLMALPLWCTALYVPLAALGLASLRGEHGLRVGSTGLLYLAAFAVVGAPFNFYWGFINAPLLALGFARAPTALATLFATAFPPSPERLTAPGRAG
jgi:hypothetical protein